VVFSDGEAWRRQRRMLTPALSPRALRHYVPRIARETAPRLQRWEAAAARCEPLDAKAEMRELAQDIVLGAIFQARLRDSGRIARAMDVLGRYIDRSMRTPVYLPPRVPTPGNLRFRRAVRELDDALLPMIASHRAEEAPPENMLSILLRARDPETGAPLEDRQLRDEIVDIAVAGHETASNTLAWTLCLLSRHPEVRARLESEVDCVLGGRTPGYEDLPRLGYAGRVIDEVLRLHPPAWVLAREAYEDDAIGGYRIPARSMVFASPHVTHRRPDLWEDPDAFDPDRFAPERVRERHRFAWYPFGGGPRICLGRLFAYAELKVVLALVAQRYRLDLLGPFPPAELGLTVGPRGPLPMRVQRRG
jgi:cytochrome P450